MNGPRRLQSFRHGPSESDVKLGLGLWPISGGLASESPPQTLTFTSLLYPAAVVSGALSSSGSHSSVFRPAYHHAEADPRDQGLPADGAAEGRAVGADQAGQGRRQVQGALLQVPLHPLRPRRRQGQQAQAVAPARSDCSGDLSITYSSFCCGIQGLQYYSSM